MNYDKDFWSMLDLLVSSGEIVIDRPRGSTHPRYNNIKYELDYGYISGTSSADGDGIDIWRGSLEKDTVDAIICTVDLTKRDTEIKLLLGCTDEEIQSVYNFHNATEFMKGMLIPRYNEEK